MDTRTASPVKKRVLQAYDNVIHLSDYIWVNRTKPDRNDDLYVHALYVHTVQTVWKNRLEDNDEEKDEKLRQVAALLEVQAQVKKEISDSSGDSPTAR